MDESTGTYSITVNSQGYITNHFTALLASANPLDPILTDPRGINNLNLLAQAHHDLQEPVETHPGQDDNEDDRGDGDITMREYWALY